MEARNIEWLGYSPEEVERVIIKLIKAEIALISDEVEIDIDINDRSDKNVTD
tara:strand:- start:60 stop:215 length:156 start_codon:yes stop_codon:yes gene_type:complete